jgi:glycogen operon protein
LGVFLNGEGIHYLDARGQQVRDDSFYVIFNAHSEPMTFTLPGEQWGRRWTKVIDTAEGDEPGSVEVKAGDTLEVESRSVVLLMRVDADD